MAFNATENSANPVILKQYWTGKRYEEVSNNYFFPICFQLHCCENGKCNSSSEEQQ
jgi:hypothetical protein